MASDLTSLRTAACARVPELLDQSMRKLGRREWYASSGYGRRSLVENAVFRYKTILGHKMRSRSLTSQRGVVDLACKILNTMTSLGMPESLRAR